MKAELNCHPKKTARVRPIVLGEKGEEVDPVFCWAEGNAWPVLHRFVFQVKNLGSVAILKLELSISSPSLNGGRQWEQNQSISSKRGISKIKFKNN